MNANIETAIRMIAQARWRDSQRLLDAIYGPAAQQLRANVAAILLGRPVSKSAAEAQYGRLRVMLFESIGGVDGNCIAERDSIFEAKAAELLTAELSNDELDAVIDNSLKAY